MNNIVNELAAQCSVRTLLVEPDGWDDVIDPDMFARQIIDQCVAALWTTECNTSDLAYESWCAASARLHEHFSID